MYTVQPQTRLHSHHRPNPPLFLFSLLIIFCVSTLTITTITTTATGKTTTTTPEERINNYRRRVGRVFIEEQSRRANTITLPSGLVVERLTIGEGTRAPAASDNCKVHYTGTLRDGTVFDSSRERGSPAQFRPSDVIKGWTEALMLMRKGDRWRIYVPHELGYGANGAGPKIPPFTPLVFDMELLEIEGGGNGRTVAEMDAVLQSTGEDKGDM
ncbi:FKBP-type peptidyl-prolyl cis-trans isomerase domain [Trypanosoma melophagium]|uniref:FKBP-type peptidyl-prolyl cis-trans isomerase domain n=1 Tax=Trypanosoma melophagium TaxID=715481 RepID=UPI00351A44D6|nr:FKBP-type peptidyl-prolyl cis-trans isomerase domain [Trypanosoma melophagium]